MSERLFEIRFGQILSDRKPAEFTESIGVNVTKEEFARYHKIRAAIRARGYGAKLYAEQLRFLVEKLNDHLEKELELLNQP